MDKLRSLDALLSEVHSSCFSEKARHHPTGEPQDHQEPSVSMLFTPEQPKDMESHPTPGELRSQC